LHLQGKNPDAPTDFLPDRDRARKEQELREQLKKVSSVMGQLLPQELSHARLAHWRNRPCMPDQGPTKRENQCSPAVKRVIFMGLEKFSTLNFITGIPSTSGQSQGRAPVHRVQLLGWDRPPKGGENKEGGHGRWEQSPRHSEVFSLVKIRLLANASIRAHLK